MEAKDKEYIKKLVKERLSAMPPNVSFSIGNFGDFTRDQLIEEVEKDSEVGRIAIKMQIDFIKKIAKLTYISN